MELLPLILGVTMGAVTSYTDLKTGFIDDVHVFPTLALVEMLKSGERPTGRLDRIPIPAVEGGILYYAYKGLSSGDAYLALAGLIGFLVGLLLGLVLYWIGAWASGDALILAGFSALLPIAPPTARFVAPYTAGYPLYPITLLLNSIIAVFPFVFGYSLYRIFRAGKTEEMRRIFVDGVVGIARLTLWILGSMGIILALENVLGLSLGGVASWVVAMVLIFVLGELGRAGDVIGLAGTLYLAYLDPFGAWDMAFRTFAVLYIIKVFFGLVKFMRREVLMEEVPVEELKEWDILGETVFEKDGEIGRDRTDPFERLKVAVFRADPSLLKPDYGRVIASPSAEGLTKEQIEELKRLVEEGKLENRFLRKKAMPFAPAIFLGFLISYFIGDLFWLLELKLMGL